MTVGVIYVGPKDDYGYNQAQAEGAAAIKAMPKVKVLEEERVPETDAVTIFTDDWSLPVREAEATNSLADQGIDVVTCHVDSPKIVVQTAEGRGMYTCGYHVNQSKLAPKGYLTGAEWNWATVYKSFVEDMQTASVCLAGSDGSFNSMGEGMFCNFDGVPIVEGNGLVDEIITCEMRPDLVREARRTWSVENNIYQFGHRGFTAVRGGARDCPYTYMKDLAEGRYRLPWEDEVIAKDGTACGFPAPTRAFAPTPVPALMRKAAE